MLIGITRPATLLLKGEIRLRFPKEEPCFLKVTSMLIGIVRLATLLFEGGIRLRFQEEEP